MAHDDKHVGLDEESEDLLADPVGAEIEDDEDDEKDPLMAGDDASEEKDWM